MQQNNLNDTRNKIIEKNASLVGSVYYKLTGKDLSISEDEYSIGLSAIDEAIDKYDKGKGAKFSTFCHTVIRGRLIDYFRKKKKEIPFSSLQTDENGTNGIVLAEKRHAIQAHVDTTRGENIREEIKELAAILREYNINFYDLGEVSPKHKDTRENLISLAKKILENENILHKIYSKKVLPLKELELLLDVKRKTLERHRRYIIVLVIILSQDYQYLKEYIGGSKIES
ncbi:RNA polymerase sigma-I factor [Alkalicella caledoniensis]|uniref:RNA polymerase sigma factor SigI n=1 Tax=Alkalicella caledoniensis TaxID=2731377 RepID=A0A7G9WAL1_ALKCA|nr:RNA polymerase sigma-I factor [Alkalicella caledoniensis]QNO15723.1 RNA polymerase sigma-I factor [Alkalicella caledoniensis]